MQPALPKPATLTPSMDHPARIGVAIHAAPADITGWPVGTAGDAPADLHLDRAALAASGFTGVVGQTLMVPNRDGTATVAFGIGAPGDLTAGTLRDAAAAFALAAPSRPDLTMVLPTASDLAPAEAAQAVVEGVLLARYRYESLKQAPSSTPVASLTIVTTPNERAEVERGATRGASFAKAAALARDLANTPPALLTAVRLGEIAAAIGTGSGLGVELFDKAALAALGCGGLLGVNAGSADPPRHGEADVPPGGQRRRSSHAGRQGHHVRLGRHQPEAGRRDARADEERHVRCGCDPRRDVGAERPEVADRGDRLPDVYRQHAVRRPP